MAGRKEKYDATVKPLLKDINAAIMRGCTEEQIANEIGISIGTLNNYKKKYPELAEALTKNKGAVALQKLVNAGIEASLGKWVDETTTVYVPTEQKFYDKETGTYKQIPEVKQQTTVRRYIPPNPTLHLFYVKMYGKDEGFVSDPAELELKAKKQEFDQTAEIAKSWELREFIEDDKK